VRVVTKATGDVSGFFTGDDETGVGAVSVGKMFGAVGAASSDGPGDCAAGAVIGVIAGKTNGAGAW